MKSFHSSVVVLVGCVQLAFAQSGSLQESVRTEVEREYEAYKRHRARVLVDSIQSVKAEIEQLQSVLERSTFGLPSYYFTDLRSWVIPSAYAFNDTLAEHFFDVTERDSTFIQQRGDIQVLATAGDSSELVGILFSGNEQERKGQRLREMLARKPERQMYKRILLSGRYGEERLLLDDRFRIRNRLQPRLTRERDVLLTQFGRVDIEQQPNLAATRVALNLPDAIRIHVGAFWGAELKLGNEESAYPFWFSGNIAALATYKQIKIGLHAPFAGAHRVSETFSKFLPARKLDGTYGAQASFDVGFGGGSFLVGLHRTDADGTFANPDSIRTLRSLAQLWYSYGVMIGGDKPNNLLRFKLGLGFHQIGFDARVGDEITPTETIRAFWSPYLHVNYLNNQFEHRFGGSVQYYNSWGIMSAWLEIVRDRMRLELKGGAPLLRKNLPWEPRYFVLLNVPLTFSFE
jgi:hypothetical protein